MKLYKKIFVLYILLLIFSGCVNKSGKDIANKYLDINIKDGKEIYFYDDHGGFHGDGTTFVTFEFSDDKVLTDIKENNKWKKLPLSNVVKTLAYGTNNNGPYITDEKGNPFFPQIESGYYYLLDRHSESSDKIDAILNRNSYNFTLGIFDEKTNRLHLCVFDT